MAIHPIYPFIINKMMKPLQLNLPFEKQDLRGSEQQLRDLNTECEH